MFRLISLIGICLILPIQIASFKPILKYNFEYTYDDLILLTKLINSESHGESKLDKLLVGSVVLNRVSSNEFPNTIKEVIYQRNQFSGIDTHLFRFNDRNYHDMQSYNAAKIVLEHGAVEQGIIYFLNPEISTNRGWVKTVSKRELVLKGRNHYFYR